MKAKLITLGVALAAGVVGYWIGCYHTRQAWERSSKILYEQAHHYHQWAKVSTNTRVLQYLADGNLSEARRALELGLDDALIKVVAYEKLYNPAGRDGIELGVVRAARDYRSHHPWASEPHCVEAVHQAFKWAD